MCINVNISVNCVLLILGTHKRFKENHFSDDFNTCICEVIGWIGASEQVLSEQRNVYLLASVEWVGTEGQELVYKAFYHLFPQANLKVKKVLYCQQKASHCK